MAALRHTILRLVSGLITLGATASALAQDTPVERPSVERPALPQPSRDQAAPVEHPETAHPAPAQPEPTSKSERPNRDTAVRKQGGGRGTDKHAGFLYLGAGLGLLSGLSGGKDFERSNPAIAGLVGVELPLARATGLGFELAVAAEFAGSADRGAYTAALLRARLSQMLAQSARLWGALGIGRAGYQNGALAGALAVGSTLMFAPKFGVDLSANVDWVGASHDDSFRNGGMSDDQEAGFVLLLAVKAMFELHKAR